MPANTKSRFNIVSESGDGAGFARRLVNEGHEVRMWIRSHEAKSVGDGLIPKVGDLEDLVHDAELGRDIFVMDVSGNGVVADYLRNEGHPTLGGSVLADRLERDRAFGTQFMLESGIKIPRTQSFTSFADAIKFVRRNESKRWVYKPSKALGDISPSHVSFDAEDLIEMLQNIEIEVDIEDPQFELQEFVQGIALSTELWLQRGEHLPFLNNHTLERKELMNGDLGPSGGCTGNIVWMCDGCPVCDNVQKLLPGLERLRYHGMVDLNVILTEDGSVYGLEFTPRFGYDASPTLFWELVAVGRLGEFFDALARGELNGVEIESESIAAGIRLTIPPWPSEKHQAEENVPIRGFEGAWEKSTYLFNVKQIDSKLVTAGAWGIIGILTGSGSSIKSAFSKPYKAIENIRLKNRQYRTDLVESFKADFDALESAIGK